MVKFAENRMRFGVFIGPYHRLPISPTIALEQDLKLVELCDTLGYDEAWIGEHHSGGVETIASPEVFIATAAERTKHIKLGTGVSTLPYHHPFMLADRIVQLDHQTRGRIMFGAGPGQLVKDARMLGIDPSTTRPRMEEALDVILRLFRGEKVTKKTDWFVCDGAELQILPYSDFDVAVVSVISPSGPKIAGRYGTGLISVAATDPVGVEMLSGHWDVWQQEAKENGNEADRSSWRLMGPMHLAETFEEAKRDVAHGMAWIEEYRSHVNPADDTDYSDLDGFIKLTNETGRGVVGTPKMAIEQIERLIEKSGGFGTYLLMGHDWANWPATQRSFELFAQEVIPYFNGHSKRLMDSYNEVVSTYEGAETTAKAQEEAKRRYADERAAKEMRR